MRELNSKEVHIGLKKNWGVEDFLSCYGFASIDELKSQLGKVYSNSRNINQVLKEMKVNSKKKCKKQNVSADSVDIAVKLVDEENMLYTPVSVDKMTASVPCNSLDVTNVLKTAEAGVIEYTNAMKKDYELIQVEKDTLDAVERIKTQVIDSGVPNAVISSAAASECQSSTEKSENENQLEFLKSTVEGLNEQIISSEGTLKELYTRKRAASKVNDELLKSLETYQAIVDKLRKEFNVAYFNYCEIGDSIIAEKEHLKGLQQEKENIDSQIRELTVISLYCGELDNVDKNYDYRLNELETDSSAIFEKVKSFFEGEVAQTGLLDGFLVSDLQKASKIIIESERIEEEKSIAVEIIFDQKSNVYDLLEFMGKKVKIS